MPHARIISLKLSNFRSYRQASLDLEGRTVLFLGANGAGKTNILEAVSFLTPGRGLRRATLEDVAATEGDGSWAVAAGIDGALGEAALGTGIEAPAADENPQRKSRIDREPVSSVTAFAKHLRVVWLTPEMDGLFLGPAAERRRFLDRLVLAIDAEHSARVSSLDRALRSRNRLLEEQNFDPKWMDAIEHEVAELAIAVAAARAETVKRLAAEIEASRDAQSGFPTAQIALDGEIERALEIESATEVEERYREKLRDNRPRDRAAGRTLEGPHRSDLIVLHREKAIEAARASTGERKALLVGLILSHARLVASMHGFAPVVLLDDVAAFLDAERRAALFAALEKLGAQVLVTGVDESAFAMLDASVARFHVASGEARRSA
ncbi:MAG: DNA replication/repair protein RecF [Xanthobacteraceae bacterium]|nr:DNA replication/repair protein RecF [Xanthobacteraceae bacterium]